jgi:hypothetical protein
MILYIYIYIVYQICIKYDNYIVYVYMKILDTIIPNVTIRVNYIYHLS